MWGALIGAGVSALGGILGSSKAASSAREKQDLLQRQQQENKQWYNERRSENDAERFQQQKENQDWYNSRYYLDYTQTAEAVNAMRKAREAANDQAARVRGQQAVVGGTAASGEAAKEAANEMVSNTLSDIAAAGTRQKNAVDAAYRQQRNAVDSQYRTQANAIDSQYMAQKNALNTQQGNIYDSQAGAAAQAGGAIMNIGGGILKDSLSNMFKA